MFDKNESHIFVYILKKPAYEIKRVTLCFILFTNEF